jgi:glycosyltransferase involved in cell wall biosynthesis
MDVCVGIVTRDRAGILRRAVESALSQDYENKRIFIYDDASTDETTDLHSLYPQVTWRRSNQPQGYLTLRNELMRSCGAKYFVSLDDDAWFCAGNEIATAVRYLEANHDMAAAAFDILSPDRPQGTPPGAPILTNTFFGCGHIVRLSHAEAVGFYSPNPGEYGGEEKDLCIRLMNAGYEICRLPGVHVWHDKTLLARDLAAQHRSGVCNDLIFCIRRCPMPDLLWNLPGKLFNHIRFAVQKNLVIPFLKGLLLFARHLGDTWRSRDPVKRKVYREFQRRAHTSQ